MHNAHPSGAARSRALFLRVCTVLTLSLSAAAALAQAYVPAPKDNLVGWSWGKHFSNRPTGFAVGSSSNDWMLNGNGYFETDVFIPHGHPSHPQKMGTYTIWVTAYGQAARGENAKMTVRVGQRAGIGPNPESFGPAQEVFIGGSAQTPEKKPFTFDIAPGRRTIRIGFTNDFYSSGPPVEDRNLIIRQVEVMHADPYAAVPYGAVIAKPKNGAFTYQSVSIRSGFYFNGSMAAAFGSGASCDLSKAGCKNILYAKEVGASDVTLTTICEVDTQNSTCSSNVNTPTEQQALKNAIGYAKDLGLTVTIKPFVLVKDAPVASYAYPEGTPDRYGWRPPSHQAAVFYDSMQAMLVSVAGIAQSAGAHGFMIGAELGGKITAANNDNLACGRWRTLIAAVRAAAPSLQYTYSPTAAGHLNNLTANEAPYVCFWDELDYIGLNAYPHMNYPDARAASTNFNKIASGWAAYARLFDPSNVSATPGTLGDCDDLYVWGASSGSNCTPPAGDTQFDPGPALTALTPGMNLSDTNPNSYRQTFNTRNFSVKWYVDHVIDAINTKFQTSLQSKGKYPLKAILTEVGAPSNHNVHGFWGSTLSKLERESLTDPNSYMNASTLPINTTTLDRQRAYVTEQAKAWDGYLRAFRGNPRIFGISVWGLAPQHVRNDPFFSPFNVETADWLLDYDFIGKTNNGTANPTEEVICAWFKRNPAPGSPCYGAVAQ